MITPPRRSVTRFFVPLIDVLILLFCIFLLMPFVSTPAADDGTKPEAKAPELPTDVQELRRQLAAAQKERDEAQKRLDRFQRERMGGVVVRTVEVVVPKRAAGGADAPAYLVGYSPDRFEVHTQAQAEEWVRVQKQLAGEKDLHVVVRYPVNRDPAGTDPPPPVSRADRTRFEAWFRGVSHSFEVN